MCFSASTIFSHTHPFHTCIDSEANSIRRVEVVPFYEAIGLLDYWDKSKLEQPPIQC